MRRRGRVPHEAFREVGGFDETFFAYWEDVDLALRLQLAGHRCVRASAARALHKHGQTLGAASPAQRRLEAFGRAYVLARYRVARRSLATRAQIALLDWPVLLVHLLVRRELGPLRERVRGTRAGLAAAPLRAPFELATVGFGAALGRQFGQLRLRATGSLPSHFDQSTGAGLAARLGPRAGRPLVDEELGAAAARQALGDAPGRRQRRVRRSFDVPAR